MINNKFSILLGERLIKITEVSERTGISRTTLTNLYYKRSKSISFKVLNKLCEFFDCSVDELIEFKK
ncbi:helix-turn-helix transcriptional regulator [Clostridium baratii]